MKLADNLPLSTPLSLMIDVSNLCNFRCSFCPTGDVKLLKSVNRPQGMMDFQLFSKIVDDAANSIKNLKNCICTKMGSLLLIKILAG